MDYRYCGRVHTDRARRGIRLERLSYPTDTNLWLDRLTGDVRLRTRDSGSRYEPTGFGYAWLSGALTKLSFTPITRVSARLSTPDPLRGTCLFSKKKSRHDQPAAPVPSLHGARCKAHGLGNLRDAPLFNVTHANDRPVFFRQTGKCKLNGLGCLIAHVQVEWRAIRIRGL